MKEKEVQKIKQSAKKKETNIKIEKSAPPIEESKRASEQRQVKMFDSSTDTIIPDLNLLNEAPAQQQGASKESIEAHERTPNLEDGNESTISAPQDG